MPINRVRLHKNMIRSRRQDTEAILYRVGLIGLLLILLLMAAAKWLGIDPFTILGKTFGPCPFYQLTHLYCPACGGTRAVQAFLHGKYVTSFIMNGFVCYALLVFAVFMVSQTIRFLSKERISGMRFHLFYIYIGIAIGVFQWMIKNAEVLM